ncbi:toxin-antitoxin system HicB family antitoxin [Spongiactinospora sp. 9N601]|uniref:toxin-antitoxin system HicB family antitoxin n=1 Tax=Spongiactinospora sp. 9N601 TaxID=3375149 RepID=UPI0037A81546
MDLMPYVDRLRHELAAAAATGGEESRAVAERLTGALEPAARLALLEALSAAAGEITRDLAPGSVEVRLRGRDPRFVVTVPQPHGQAPEPGGEPAPPVPPVSDADEGSAARVSLRVPEHLKARIEEAAGREGLSLNAWLVRALTAAVQGEGGRARTPRRQQTGHRYTGWVR